jgi:hypothetical protein
MHIHRRAREEHLRPPSQRELAHSQHGAFNMMMRMGFRAENERLGENTAYRNLRPRE